MNRNLLLSFLLVSIVAIQVSYSFKPAKQITGPFGRALGNRFNFSREADTFNLLPSRTIVTSGCGGINSISFVYTEQAGETRETGGRRSKTVTEISQGFSNNIVKAEVCSGKRSGNTIITGLKFVYEDGTSSYFYGNATGAKSLICVDASPKTSGYYLQYLSGRYGSYINQLQFHWVSNFEEEKACLEDEDCEQEVDICPSDYCCYSKRLADGEWQNSALCA